MAGTGKPSGKSDLPPRGIFMMHEAQGPVQWQARPPDSRVDLAKRIAFNCFLCGVELSKQKGVANQATDEDVFARWLQRRFDLPGQAPSLARRAVDRLPGTSHSCLPEVQQRISVKYRDPRRRGAQGRLCRAHPALPRGSLPGVPNPTSESSIMRRN